MIRFREGTSALVQERISTFLGSGLGSLPEIGFVESDSVVFDSSTFVFSTMVLSGDGVAASS